MHDKRIWHAEEKKVSKMRLELTQPTGHYPLKVARLPIPPPGLQASDALSEKRDSNPRPRPWQGRALPTELFSHFYRGFNPSCQILRCKFKAFLFPLQIFKEKNFPEVRNCMK